MNDRYTNSESMNDVSTKIICFMNDGYTKKAKFYERRMYKGYKRRMYNPRNDIL